MAIWDSAYEKRTNKLLINSIEDELDELLQEEFYDGRRTPSYAVKFVRDSIENHPTTESCLSRSHYISLSSTEYVNKARRMRPGKATLWKNDNKNGLFISNGAHRYLSNTEVVAENAVSHLGRPTRATLLKERMTGNCSRSGSVKSSSGRSNTCGSCITNNAHKAHLEANRSKKCYGSEIRHAFLVGARYNAAHFLDLDSIRVKGLYVSKNNNGVVFTNSSGNHSAESDIASPPNSPQSNDWDVVPPTLITSQQTSDQKMPQYQTPSITNENIIRNTKRRKPVENDRTMSRSYTPNNNPKIMSPKGLPVVTGSRWIPFNIESSSSRSPLMPRTCWTRSAINIHFSKQNRFLQNRCHDHRGQVQSERLLTAITPSRDPSPRKVECEMCLHCTKLNQDCD